MLAVAKHAQGDLEGARAALLESLQGYREFGDRGGVATVLMNLAKVTQDMGDPAAAKARMQEAWDWLPRGHSNERLEWLDAVAGMLQEPGRVIDAARLWGCV